MLARKFYTPTIECYDLSVAVVFGGIPEGSGPLKLLKTHGIHVKG